MCQTSIISELCLGPHTKKKKKKNLTLSFKVPKAPVFKLEFVTLEARFHNLLQNRTRLLVAQSK